MFEAVKNFIVNAGCFYSFLFKIFVLVFIVILGIWQATLGILVVCGGGGEREARPAISRSNKISNCNFNCNC